MRPPRFIIAGAFFISTIFLTLFCLRSSHAEHSITSTSTSPPKSGIQAIFSFRAPFSIFPPNAVITLTHDNTTAFLARPAAFGPKLPGNGLKGQLWIGSGFGDDSIRQGPIVAGAEGELGCSDVPGWADTFSKPAAVVEGSKSTDSKSATTASKSKAHRRSIDEDGPFNDRTAAPDIPPKRVGGEARPSIDDGTDDYLHHLLTGSSASYPTDKQSTDSTTDHADIQSLQEGAEIAGKVVLLSRGGCGFLEKVKWAQRRGALALIVGDDTAGGALIQMYARGDTSNVTIPSVFTSRTTAHLLSSLIGRGAFIEDTIDENGKPTLRVKHTGKKNAGQRPSGSRPTFTPAAAALKPAVNPRATSKTSKNKGVASSDRKPPEMTTDKPGWIKSLFGVNSKVDTKSESSRPPSSGELDWVLVDDWRDEGGSGTQKVSTKPKSSDSNNGIPEKLTPGKQTGDDFVIGVQDWRDPDLVGSSRPKEDDSGKVNGAKEKGQPDPIVKHGDTQPTKVGGKKHIGGALQEVPDHLPPLRGGSITPGSGEYGTKNAGANDKEKEKEDQRAHPISGGKSLLTTIFGDDEENVELSGSSSSKPKKAGEKVYKGFDDEKEGLWVTLTPTSGASPFLDTLLVLVVSPLVTLTVVYALLLIRSRIRRRRWRAPKSVVERLPVRTYQTIVGSGNQSPRVPNPTGSSLTTPLLQTASSGSARARPRSRTTTGIVESEDLMRVGSAPLQVPSIPPPAPEQEKNASESSEWKKHMGKQVECVVCLEEYVDGISRVMSLPCGHEFHEDCITPWLTTRRRTCPICKGDVVRSLARGSPSNPRYVPYRDDDDSDDDVQAQAAETVNPSLSSALPIGRIISDEDLEQGAVSPSTSRPRLNQLESWRSMLASSLGSSSRSPSATQEDRNR